MRVNFFPWAAALAVLLTACQTAPQAQAPSPNVTIATPEPAPQDRSLARCDGTDGSLILSQDLPPEVVAKAPVLLKACKAAQ